jgi:membrane associated rhomboid family serine protease
MRKLKISFNSPVVLGFTAVCFAALILNTLTGGIANSLFFSVYRASLRDPLTYVRIICHVFGHADWSHFMGNIMLILILGPLLEEKYGSRPMAAVIFITALFTGAANMLLFPHTMLLGASGVVFAFIMLSSLASLKEGSVPLTFILVAVIYIGGQIYSGITVQDNISNITHIIGGFVGAAMGFAMGAKKARR